jgi:hypothetical protein
MQDLLGNKLEVGDVVTLPLDHVFGTIVTIKGDSNLVTPGGKPFSTALFKIEMTYVEAGERLNVVKASKPAPVAPAPTIVSEAN